MHEFKYFTLIAVIITAHIVIYVMKFVNFTFYFGIKKKMKKNNSRKKSFPVSNLKTGCNLSFLSQRSAPQPGT